jgi:predicted ribonuclease YlaK
VSSLSTFIVAESLKTRSVLALHRFDTLFKHQVTKDLQQELYAAWRSTARTLKVKVDKQTAEDAVFKNPKATVALVVSDKLVKLFSSAENGRVKLVSPSVKLPLLLSAADAGIAREAFLADAAKQFELAIHGWSEVFMHELKSGQVKTDFCVKRDNRSVRLCLTAADKSIEHETVLYHVTIEHGKLGSKVRDYDTIFLSIDR